MDKSPLSQLLHHLKENPHTRLAVVGVGHELRGDDGVGPAIIHALQEALAEINQLLLIDAGPAPENYSGKLREFGPDIILLIDAAEIGLPPGAYQLIEFQDLDGFSGSSHTLPLSLISIYLQIELNCKVLIIGIQPQILTFGSGLSDPVQSTAASLIEDLVYLLKDSTG